MFLNTQTVPSYPNLIKDATRARVIFVDSNGGGSTTSDGKSPATARTTVNSAVDLCTASKGDIIVCLPGHAETISAADGVDLDVAGIQLIGLGWGAMRPTFTFSATASTFAIGAANVTLRNLRFVAGVSAVVKGVDVEAFTDTTIEDCEWYWGGTTGYDFAIACNITVAAHRTRIRRCKFFGEPVVTGCSEAILLCGPSNYCEFTNNEFVGDYDPSCIAGTTAASLEVLIDGNMFYNTNADETAIEMSGNTTGVISNNIGFSSAATIAGNIVCAKGVFCNNYICNTVNTIAVQKGAGGTADAD